MKGTVAHSWECKPLGEVCDVLDRLRKPITKRDRVAGPYAYYGATGVLDHVADFIFDEPLVLVGEDGAKWGAGDNSAFAISGKTWVNNHAHVLRPHRDVVLDDWLIYYLNGSDLSDFISGMTVPKLNQGRLREIPIPLPPLEEQQRIVAVLDEAFEGLARARAHAEANLQNAQELMDEMISRRFDAIQANGSSVQPLGEMADFRNGLNFTRTSIGADIKVVGVGDFKDNFEVPVGGLSSVTIDGELAEADRLQSGDILAVRSNGNRELIGRTMVVPELDEPVSFSGFTIRIRLTTDDFSPGYLCEFMKTREARAKLTAGGGGANISNLNQRLLAGFPVTYPSRKEQGRVLDELNAIRSHALQLAVQYQDQLDDFDDLRKSLLQKAFSGELS